MQEGVIALMQMAKTVVAFEVMHDAGLPVIVVLAHPTTGGVWASFASLGDVTYAEPGALIAFSGPRVIEQTTREKLPPDFGRAETQLPTARSTRSSTAASCRSASARCWASSTGPTGLGPAPGVHWAQDARRARRHAWPRRCPTAPPPRRPACAAPSDEEGR